MDQLSIVNLVRPHFQNLVEFQQQAFADFDTYQPPEVRLTVGKARPKWVNCRMLWYLDQHFGRGGSPRFISQRRLSYLYVEGDDFSVGLRPKKFDSCWKVRNHDSGQQRQLRQGGRFPWHKDTAHVFLGYRMTPGLEPSLSHIALTHETQTRVEWVYVIWSSEEGVNPAFQPIQPPLPILPPPTVRVRKKDREGRKDVSG